MKILLDTHFVLWSATDPGRITDKERLILSDSDADVYISSVSIWELRIKWNSLSRKGEVPFDFDPIHVLAYWQHMNVKFVDLSPQLAVAVLKQALPHKDPFDQILVILAQEIGARILTRDDDILTHPLAIAA